MFTVFFRTAICNKNKEWLNLSESLWVSLETAWLHVIAPLQYHILWSWHRAGFAPVIANPAT